MCSKLCQVLIIQHQNYWQILWKYCQIGEISPNQVVHIFYLGDYVAILLPAHYRYLEGNSRENSLTKYLK